MNTRLVCCIFAIFSVSAHGANTDNYPTKPVRIIVPFPGGGAADNLLRPVARKMGDYWGKSVVIDNRAGIPGIQVAAVATPDGYTLMLGSGSSMVTGPLIRTKRLYEPQRDFVPLSQLARIAPVLTTHPSVNARSIKELIALAKSKPGNLNYSSSGLGNPGHLSMELFMMMTGTNMVHVPYKGGAQSVTELAAGLVQLGFNAIPSVMIFIKSGKLRPLAVASSYRARALPELPTIQESGVPGFDYDIWYGLFAISKTSPVIIEKVSHSVQRALKEAEVAQLIMLQGAEEPAPSTSAEFPRFIREDTARWSKVIKTLNLKVD